MPYSLKEKTEFLAIAKSLGKMTIKNKLEAIKLITGKVVHRATIYRKVPFSQKKTRFFRS